MTVTVFGNLILISKDFYDFISPFLLRFSSDWKDISNTDDGTHGASTVSTAEEWYWEILLAFLTYSH